MQHQDALLSAVKPRVRRPSTGPFPAGVDELEARIGPVRRDHASPELAVGQRLQARLDSQLTRKVPL
jgi:hypothetical protein